MRTLQSMYLKEICDMPRNLGRLEYMIEIQTFAFFLIIIFARLNRVYLFVLIDYGEIIHSCSKACA